MPFALQVALPKAAPTVSAEAAAVSASVAAANAAAKAEKLAKDKAEHNSGNSRYSFLIAVITCICLGQEQNERREREYFKPYIGSPSSRN